MSTKVVVARPLHVAIDVSPLFRRYRRHSGIPHVVGNLLAALSQNQQVRLTPFVNCSELGKRLDRRQLRAALKARSIAALYDCGRCDGIDLAGQPLDVIHSTFYPPPMWFLDFARAWVATIHDLRPLDDPGSVEDRHIKLFGRLGGLVRERATLIHCISHFTASRVRHHWMLPAERTRVIHHGAKMPSSELSTDKPTPFARPYVLFLGTIQPAKQVDIAIEAFSMVVADPRFRDLRLVVAGSEMRFEPDSATWRGLVKSDNVVRLKRVSDVRKVGLLCQANAVLCTSTYEGFGLVPVEAIALSVPPIVSTAHPCLELLRDWPYRFPTGCVSECAEILQAVLMNPEVAKLAMEKARNRLALWTWGKVASEFVRVYREALERPSISPPTSFRS